MSETETAPAETLPTTVPDTAGEPRWEIARQWNSTWRKIRWSVSALVVVLGLVVVGQVFLFHQMFAEIHPLLGWAFTMTMLGAAGWFIGRPLLSFLSAPKIAEAPDVDLNDPSISWEGLSARSAYDAEYLKGMSRNPTLADTREEILQAEKEIQGLCKRIDARDKAMTAVDFAKELSAFERDRIAPLLKPLDKAVDDYIQKEALAVGTATAISLNGSIDAFIVLWRNINMVSRISRLYYGRPSLRLSFLILRDVMGAVLLSRALEDVSQAAGEALGGLVTRLGGMVVGPMLDGSVNAVVTSKIGQLSKRRCRSFDVWSEATATRVTREVYEQVKRESTNLVGEIVKLSGGFINGATTVTGAVVGGAVNVAGGAADLAVGAAGKVLNAPRSAWSMVQDTFVRKPKTDSPPQPTE